MIFGKKEDNYYGCVMRRINMLRQWI